MTADENTLDDGSSHPSTARPLLIYDGDCNFCRRWIGRWRQITGDRVDYAASQAVGEQYPQIAPEEFKRSVQLVEPSGEVFSGVHAVFRTLARAPGRGWPLWLYEHTPGLRGAAEGAYAFVARHRSGFSTLTNLLWGRHLDPPTYRISQWLLLRGSGAVYLIAFLSLWSQIDGLMGSRGIVPVHDWLAMHKASWGTEYYWRVPTLCWRWDSNHALHVMCGLGTASAAALMLGMLPWPAAAVCWVLYLSLFHASGFFLSFQWDLLLLEAGFLALMFAPLCLWSRPSRDRPAPRNVRFLFVLLIFKLMLSSGVVKLTWEHEPNWRMLTALQYHYETQPLPPWTAWYVHHWSLAFQKLSCMIVFFIEIGLAFLVWGPRRLKQIAAAGFILLMILISITGNYCFFNLLTVLLCLPLLDDLTWPAWLRRLVLGTRQNPRRAARWRGWAAAPFAVVIVLFSALEVVSAISGPMWQWPESLETLRKRVSPFAIASGYGLFRSMTTFRHELVLEGSDDGREWQAYEFKYKPGDVKRRPAFVAPHQPRLDWQMWFVPLGPSRQNSWLFAFVKRLLEGSPPVLGLLDRNPFPDHPPRYIRILEYDYHFSDAKTKQETGAWWTRDLMGLYLRPVSLEMFRER